MRRWMLCSSLVLAAACSRSARRDATPPLRAEVAEAASLEAARLGAGPALTEAERIEHVLARATFGARPGDRERVARVGIAAFLEEQLHPEELDDGRVEKLLREYPVLQRSTGSLAHELQARRMEKRKEDEAKADAAARALEDARPITASEAARRLASPVASEAARRLAAPSASEAARPLAPPNAPMPPPRPPATRGTKDLKKALGRAGRGPGYDFVSELSEAKLVRAIGSERQLQELMVDFWFNHFNVFAGKENESALLPEYEAQLRRNALGSFGDLLAATAHSPAMLVYLDNRLSSAPDPKKRRGLNENYARELLELHTLGVDGGYTQADVVEVARCFTGWTVDEPNENPRFVFRPKLHDDGPKRVLGHLIAAGGGERDGRQVLAILLAHPATARFVSRKLVRRFVSDDPPEPLVLRVAATFAKTHGDVRSLLRTVFEAPELWSRRALRAKVRSPLELVAGTIRALGASVDDPLELAKAVARIGEPLYGAQPPTGYGDTAQAWISSGGLLARIDFGLQLASGQLKGVSVDLSPLAANARGPEEVLSRVASRLGAGELSAPTREYLLAQLQKAPKKPELQAARAVGLLLGAPELQRR